MVATRRAKAGRNDPCPCGSGKKYKQCCQGKERQLSPGQRILLVLIAVAVGGMLIFAAVSVARGPAPAPPGMVWSDEHGHYH